MTPCAKPEITDRKTGTRRQLDHGGPHVADRRHDARRPAGSTTFILGPSPQPPRCRSTPGDRSEMVNTGPSALLATEKDASEPGQPPHPTGSAAATGSSTPSSDRAPPPPCRKQATRVPPPWASLPPRDRSRSRRPSKAQTPTPIRRTAAAPDAPEKLPCHGARPHHAPARRRRPAPILRARGRGGLPCRRRQPDFVRLCPRAAGEEEGEVGRWGKVAARVSPPVASRGRERGFYLNLVVCQTNKIHMLNYFWPSQGRRAGE